MTLTEKAVGLMGVSSGVVSLMKRNVGNHEIGRNDPCLCGSGKKYKKCCLSKINLDREPVASIPAEVMRQFRERQKKEYERTVKFGKLKPGIGIDFKGYKFVAVGSRLFYSKKWKYFLDFLLQYLPATLGEKWIQAETAKLLEGQHQIVQWRRKAYGFMKDRNGQQGIVPGGFLAAYAALAYDLYTVEHNGRLDDELLTRLKHRDLFQGARHELFAEATCLRAGYNIEHEDETDKSKRHVEFTAIHKPTKQKISIEAKSKHRRGILGFPGKPQQEKELNLRFGPLLNDAIKKNPPNPLVIFLDTNLPTAVAEKIFSPASTDPLTPPRMFMKMLDRIRKKHNGKDPYNLAVFSNHPHYYTKDEEIDPKKHLLSIVSRIPIRQVVSMQAIIDIHEAANKYGNIPTELPS